MILEKGIEYDIERKNLATIDMVAYLPANRTSRREKTDRFGNTGCLILYVFLLRSTFSYGLPIL